MIQKPRYGTSKRAIWLNSIAAWVVILTLTFGAVYTNQVIAFASLAVPLMAALIATMLGIHRGFGSFDMRTMSKHPLPPFPPEGQP